MRVAVEIELTFSSPFFVENSGPSTSPIFGVDYDLLGQPGINLVILRATTGGGALTVFYSPPDNEAKFLK